MNAALDTGDDLMDWDRPLVGGPGSPWPHPDEELLRVCQQLQAQQAQWQRLWTLTSDGPGDVTDADRAWTRYTDEVWPGTPGMTDDLPARLLTLSAITAEGLRAKAAAVKAMEQVGCYTGSDRDDILDFVHAVLTDAAGDAYMPLGEDHPEWKARP